MRNRGVGWSMVFRYWGIAVMILFGLSYNANYEVEAETSPSVVEVLPSVAEVATSVRGKIASSVSQLVVVYDMNSCILDDIDQNGPRYGSPKSDLCWFHEDEYVEIDHRDLVFAHRDFNSDVIAQMKCSCHPSCISSDNCCDDFRPVCFSADTKATAQEIRFETTSPSERDAMDRVIDYYTAFQGGEYRDNNKICEQPKGRQGDEFRWDVWGLSSSPNNGGDMSIRVDLNFNSSVACSTRADCDTSSIKNAFDAENSVRCCELIPVGALERNCATDVVPGNEDCCEVPTNLCESACGTTVSEWGCSCDPNCSGNCCPGAEATCGPPGVDTPCLSGADCGPGLTCRGLNGVCGEATCQPATLCTQQFDPVMGCDDNIYSNICHALNEGGGVPPEDLATQGLQTSRPEPFVNANGRCLGLVRADEGNLRPRARGQSCNNRYWQKWRFQGDRLVNGMGKCLEVKQAELGMDGGRVRGAQCNNQIRQKWDRVGQTLVNRGGHCLEIKSNGQLKVASCWPKLTQTWRRQH